MDAHAAPWQNMRGNGAGSADGVAYFSLKGLRMNILLVSPKTPETFWGFQHVLRLVAKKAAFPPLGLLTVAAMLPEDWNLRLVDLNVRRLDDADLRWADYVFLSAMIVQRESVEEIVRRCTALGRPIVAGGPLFTTGHENFPAIPHFVIGEAEEVMPELVADLRAGTPRSVYRAPALPSLTRTPLPRWDLIRMRDYVTMAVQFSRGCPFDCEFCDIIVLNGRVPRTKAPAQFVAELEDLRRRGWKDMVFVVDDNFIGNKPRTRELLHAMIEWRARTRPKMGFLTEASLNLADDTDLRALMVAAGFRKVFVGIETPLGASLDECRKHQNRNRDLVADVQQLQRAGLEVMGGFIVGFDHDTSDIFQRQFEFIQRSGVVTAMVGLLTALPQTRLHQRLQREGRLLADSTGNNTAARLNFLPRLNREYLETGYRELMRRLYEPRNYYRRIRVFLDNHRKVGGSLRLSHADTLAFLRSFWLLGIRHRGRLAYWWFSLSTLLRRPRQFRVAIELAIIGHHFRRVASRL
jgi:radical SAM superfamily enzyme YgiQ (UPF0313 family)